MTAPTDRFSQGALNIDPNDDSPAPTSGVVASGADVEQKQEKLGPLLDLEPEKAAKLAQKYWDRQNQAMEKRTPRWQANALRRKGYANVIVQKAQDSDRMTVYVPRGSTRTPPSLNKAARLCRRLKANIFVDPPVPECVPSSDADDSREAAEAATKVLQDLTSPAGYNGLRTARRAFDLASTYGSGFVRLYVSPTGGGMQPVEIQASPNATSVADATHQQVSDPMTGQITEQPWPGELITRYVALDGQSLTDDPGQAARDWVPGICAEILKGTHVRMLPESALDISEADGVMVASFARLGDLKTQFADAYPWDNDEEVRKLLNFVPEAAKDILPAGQKSPRRVEDDGELGDDTEIYVLTVYYEQCPTYPKGAYCIFAGGETALDRRPWVAEIDDDESPREDALEVPIAQFKQFEEGDEDAYGYGAMDLLGTGNELRNALFGYGIEFLEQTAKRKVFVPINSAIKPQAFQGPTGMPIPFNAQAGKPEWEPPQELPASLIQMRDTVTQELDDELGIQAVAQGMTDPSVSSGLHAQQLIEQVAAALSDVKQNTEDGIERMWRVTLQLWRAFIPNARRVKWVGDDAEYKEQALSAADIRDTRDVRIMKGSFTMLTPSAKAAVTQSWMQAMMVSPQEAKRLLRGNVSAMTGAMDDPHLMRIRRQIAQFNDGPPDGFEQQVQQATLAQQQQAAAMQPAIDEANAANQRNQITTANTGLQLPQVPVPQAPTGPPPVQGAPFADVLLVDTEPQPAQTRYEELSAFMAGSKYGKQPPFWRQYLDAEWQRMKGSIQAAQAAMQAAAAPQQHGAQPLGEQGGKPPALAVTANPEQPNRQAA